MRTTKMTLSQVVADYLDELDTAIPTEKEAEKWLDSLEITSRDKKALKAICPNTLTEVAVALIIGY